ncbi:MAG TPA: hypothetical protein VN894_01990 [Polyangiaceae bacterium]|nr:hypothetical protein [Polyangiaceae bacterium]
MLYRLYMALAAISLAACARIPSPAPVPTYDASDAAPYAVGDGAPGTETPCQLACDRLSAICGPQGAACPTVWDLIESRQEIQKPHGGALSCSDVLLAHDRAGMLAIGVTTCGAP